MGQLQACGRTDSLKVATWDDRGCDTNRTPDVLSVYDAVVPFRLADSLRATLKTTPKIFFTTWQDTTLTQWALVEGQMGATARQTIVPEQAAFASKQLTLNWIDVAYLWSLADSPEYLYNRWEMLLGETRQAFIEKRTSITADFGIIRPKYEAKVISDLRTAATQGRFLLKGASAAPVSHHQLGLASDFAIIYQKRYQRAFPLYKQLGDVAKAKGLTWGGEFVGFVDPPHVQMFYNSAALVQQFPALRFEFEPYRYFYLKKVKKKIAEGKEPEVLDTEQLLSVLNELRRNQPCPCEQVERLKKTEYGSSVLASLGYNPSQDILLVANPSRRNVTLVHPSGNTYRFKVGKWR